MVRNKHIKALVVSVYSSLFPPYKPIRWPVLATAKPRSSTWRVAALSVSNNGLV